MSATRSTDGATHRVIISQPGAPGLANGDLPAYFPISIRDPSFLLELIVPQPRGAAPKSVVIRLDAEILADFSSLYGDLHFHQTMFAHFVLRPLPEGTHRHGNGPHQYANMLLLLMVVAHDQTVGLGDELPPLEVMYDMVKVKQAIGMTRTTFGGVIPIWTSAIKDTLLQAASTAAQNRAGWDEFERQFPWEMTIVITSEFGDKELFRLVSNFIAKMVVVFAGSRDNQSRPTVILNEHRRISQRILGQDLFDKILKLREGYINSMTVVANNHLTAALKHPSDESCLWCMSAIQGLIVQIMSSTRLWSFPQGDDVAVSVRMVHGVLEDFQLPHIDIGHCVECGYYCNRDIAKFRNELYEAAGRNLLYRSAYPKYFAKPCRELERLDISEWEGEEDIEAGLSDGD